LLNPSTWASTSDIYNWLYYSQGGRVDASTGLIRFGARDYNPATGTWMEPDGGYWDGSDLYQAEENDPVNRDDPSGRISVFIAGASRYSRGQYESGSGMLYNDPWIINNVPGGRIVATHRQFSWALAEILKAHAAAPCEPIFIVGHSWGAATALKLAVELKERGIQIDGLITIDPVDLPNNGDDGPEVPDNVKFAANIYNDDDSVMIGNNRIKGAINYGIKGANHKSIAGIPETLEKVRAAMKYMCIGSA
jgi:RHS repeat-associated protein